MNPKNLSHDRSGTALVLGAAGFIGRHACRQLADAGFDVLGLGRGRWDLAELASYGITRWLAANVDSEGLRAITDRSVPDVIVHCAGSSSVANSFKGPAEDFASTVDSTLALLEFVRQCIPQPKVVLVSSAALYGDQGDQDLVEDSLPAPMSPYGRHKLMAEMLCRSYHDFFGVRVTVVRLFSVFGEGLRKQLLWDAMNKFEQGMPSFFGTGDELRDWIHVEDAARLLTLAALDDHISYAVYNGGNVRATTRELLTRMAAHAAPSLTPVFTGQAHAGNPIRLTASHERAARVLGFTGKIGLDEGLSRYAAWFRTQERC